MKTMTRWTMAGALALAGVGAAAVIDVGTPSAEAAPSVSPFAGNWSGTWTGVENGQDGTLDWTVSDAGRLTGRVFHTQDGEGGEIRGHIRVDGFVMMCAFAPSDDLSHGSGVPLQGTAGIDGDGKLNMSIAITGGGASFVLVLERN
jgi:hypothetical protein